MSDWRCANLMRSKEAIVKLKRIIFSSFLVVLLMTASATLVFATDANYALAEKLAIDFLTDMHLVEIFPSDHVVDFSKYTSVEKFIEYMDLHMAWIIDYYQLVGGSGYGTSYDDYTFETEATDFKEVDGGLLITMHIKRFYHYISSDDWGGGENSVYVLVAEGENGLEIRDYNNPHTGWDGIRGDSFIPTDPDYWINSTDIESVLEYVRRTNAEGLKIYAQDYGVTEEDRILYSEVEESPPQTGSYISVICPLTSIIAITLTASNKKTKT